MKKQILSSFGFLISLSLFSQPTLTQSNHAYVVGDIATMTLHSTSSSFGSAGANQTWNLTFSGTPTTLNSIISAPANTPAGTSFPGASVAYVNGGTDYAYYNVSSAELELVGAYSANAGVTFNYSDGEEQIRYPFTYNDSFTDTWSNTYLVSGFLAHRIGTSNVQADGYGTLTTPAGTFTNVLRLKYIQNYKDSINIMGTTSVTLINSENYVWYTPGTHFPLATIASYTINGSTSTTSYYMSGGLTNLDDNSVNIQESTFYPNPSEHLFTLKTNDELIHAVTVIDILGQPIFTNTNFTAGQSIDLNPFAQGVYFAHLTSSKGTKVITLVKK